jgi:aminopeptidase N
MEYPGLIVTGGPWYSPLIGSRALSAVTFHELAHQWFYGLVATDEALYPVLDEGLASWAELYALTEKYGAGSAYSGFGVTISASAFAQLMGTGGYRPGPLASSAASFGTFSQLTHSVYARMTLLLQTIGNVYGQEKLRAALRYYSLQNRFSHPPPQALVSAFEAKIGHAAAKNLETALYSDGWVDFEPVTVSSRRVASGVWKSSVRVRRSGTLILPVDVAVAFTNGQVLNHECEPDAEECSFEFESPTPVTSVTVDPNRKIAIESRCTNNTIWQTVPPKPPLLLERLIYALQLVLGGTLL